MDIFDFTDVRLCKMLIFLCCYDLHSMLMVLHVEKMSVEDFQHL